VPTKHACFEFFGPHAVVTRSDWKYTIDNFIVYRDVYRGKSSRLGLLERRAPINEEEPSGMW